MRWLQFRHSAMAGLLALSSLVVANGVMAASTVTFGSLGGSNGDTFTSYSEAGFNVNINLGSVLVGQESGKLLPSLYGTAMGSIVVTADASQFSFDSVDLLGTGGNINYTIIGSTGGLVTSGGNQVFLINDSLGGGSFTNIPSGHASLIDTLFISVTPTGTSTSFNIDNIGVTAVPVPAAVWLFGSGLVGLAGVVRRRK